MKKILITLMIALISNTSNTNHTFEDLQATPHKKEELCTTFLDAAKLFEECEDTNNSLQYLEEYDHNITDNVTPPQIGGAEALFREALGVLLVRYISLREATRMYFKEVKSTLAKWYHTIIKS